MNFWSPWFCSLFCFGAEKRWNKISQNGLCLTPVKLITLMQIPISFSTLMWVHFCLKTSNRIDRVDFIFDSIEVSIELSMFHSCCVDHRATNLQKMFYRFSKVSPKTVKTFLTISALLRHFPIFFNHFFKSKRLLF